jgi:hypothetical protein
VVNGQETTVIDMHLTQGSVVQATYGFWRNSTSVFLNTANNNYLEGTDYNYSCVPTSSRPSCYHDYVMPPSATLNPLPELLSCTTLMQIPFVISDGGLPFCKAVVVSNNTETGGIGFTSSSQDWDCVIKVKDSSDVIFYITLHSGSYRFFKEVTHINCEEAGDGNYINCGLDIVNSLNPKNMTYDVGAKIQVVSDKYVPDGSGNSVPNPFSNSLKNNVVTVVVIIIIVIIVITGIVIGICILRCLISLYCQTRGKGGGI